MPQQPRTGTGKKIAARLFMFCVFTAAVSSASTLIVPDEYSSIHLAIRAAENGDTVLVRPGTYFENVDFQGKEISLLSEKGPSATVIDASQKGSAVYIGNGEGKGTCLDGFTITNGTGKFIDSRLRGGGVCVTHGASPTIRNNIIINCTAYSGGGICSYGKGCTPLIHHNTIVKNFARSYGGGVCTVDSDAVIDANFIAYNETSYWGGGVEVYKLGAVSITNNYIAYNRAGQGGGVSNSNSSSPLIAANEIIYNQASCGGGIYFYSGTVSGNIIMHNTARQEWQGYVCGAGGGMWCIAWGKISGNIIAENRSYGWGGGVILSAVGMLENNLICNNTAKGTTVPKYHDCGGGVYVETNWQDAAPIVNCLITNNESGEYGGGIYLMSDAKAAVYSCTIASNAAPEGSGAYCYYDSELQVSNSILWNSEKTELYYDTIAPIIAYSDVCGGYAGTGNIDVDPQFVNPADLDYHLSFQSPCRNAGTNAAAWIPSKDIDGNDRIIEGLIDMGADEFGRCLYFTGETFPGGMLQTNFIGFPGDTTTLFAGSALLPKPKRTPCGAWYLADLLLSGQVGTLPFSGHMAFETRIPPDAAAPAEFFAQALMRDELTPCAALEVGEKP